MDFLKLAHKTVVVFGVANKRSVAWAATRTLKEAGASVIHVLRNAQVHEDCKKLLADAPVIYCDFEDKSQIDILPEKLTAHTETIDGLLHSVAYARYDPEQTRFHETKRTDFLQAIQVSCFSLVEVTHALLPMLADDASVVTVSISNTQMAAENYGYMGPVKGCLDSTVAFLAKSIGQNTARRVNAVGASLLKTSSSAGIPGYLDAYLYAERVIPRQKTLKTAEVGDTIVYLLSPRSSGINAQKIVVDAGMGINFFDQSLVQELTR